MAITKTAINNDYSTLQSFLQSSGLFASVELGTDAVTMKDADGNTLATISDNSGSAQITAYADASNSVAGNYSTNGRPQYAYKCTNGIMLQIFNPTPGSGNTNWKATILIAKTNNNKIAFIFSKDLKQDFSNLTEYYCVAWGDDVISINTFTAKTLEQTLMCPFCTNATMGEQSYTPNAFWLPFGQYYNMGYGKLTDDGTTYLTNGYWCIKDT